MKLRLDCRAAGFPHEPENSGRIT